jgi:VanZ family protein
MMAPPKLILKIPAPLLVVVIWILSAQSTLPVPKGILGFDKFQHLLAYLALAVSVALWFSPEQRRRRRLRSFLLIVLISSFYGIIDEIHQFFVPGRNCNVWDWIADALGAVLGAAAALLADRLILSKRGDGQGGHAPNTAV